MSKKRMLGVACWVFLAVVAGSAESLRAGEPAFGAVECVGHYRYHLQGVCTDERSAIFWSFTDELVKTDREGTILEKVPGKYHYGDICYADEKVYVAVNLGKFNDPEGNADSWVYVYDGKNLALLEKHKTDEVFHGAGGIAYHDGKFLVVGGLPDGVEENYLYEYDADFQFVKKHVLESGHTHLGIQTATFADGCWWFGCYGDPKILLKADADLQKVERYEFDCSLGIVPIAEGRFLIGRGQCSLEKGCSGRLVVGVADEERGLVVESARTQR